MIWDFGKLFIAKGGEKDVHQARAFLEDFGGGT